MLNRKVSGELQDEGCQDEGCQIRGTPGLLDLG